jgi:catechol 2,3-dioxygenase-like lactoylglutathione lyase family enzyme
MSTVYRLEHVGLGAAPDRYDETVAFYERVFGWHRIKESAGEMTFLGDGAGGRLEILPRNEPPLVRPHHLAFVIDDQRFEAVIQALQEAGARPEPPSTNSFGDRLVFFTDPAGNAAQIVSRVAPLAP